MSGMPNRIKKVLKLYDDYLSKYVCYSVKILKYFYYLFLYTLSRCKYKDKDIQSLPSWSRISTNGDIHVSLWSRVLSLNGSEIWL